MANGFGEYLRRARQDAGLTQIKVASIAKTSQSLISQYEGGDITDPDPKVLKLLAKAYGLSYLEMVLRFVRSRFGDKENWHEGADHFRWDIIESVARPVHEVGGVPDHQLELAQLRSEAELIRELEVLDVQGILQWIRAYPDFSEIWIVVPDFLDDKDDAIRRDVAEYIQKGRRITYFAQEGEELEGGRLWHVREALTEYITDRNVILAHTDFIGLKRDELSFLQSDHVVIDPHRPERAIGFQYVRRNRRPYLAIRMHDVDLAVMLERLTPLVRMRSERAKQPLQIVPTKTKRSLRRKEQ